MNVLIYGNRKTEDIAFDISTPEKEAAAYLALFKILDEEWGVYSDLEEFEDETHICAPCAKDLHTHCERNECECRGTPECASRARHVEWHRREMREWKRLYTRIKDSQDGAAAKKLLKDRSHRQYEYETIHEMLVRDPLEKL